MEDKNRSVLIGMSYEQGEQLAAELFALLTQKPTRVGLILEQKDGKISAIKAINPVWEE